MIISFSKSHDYQHNSKLGIVEVLTDNYLIYNLGLCYYIEA